MPLEEEKELYKSYAVTCDCLMAYLCSHWLHVAPITQCVHCQRQPTRHLVHQTTGRGLCVCICSGVNLTVRNTFCMHIACFSLTNLIFTSAPYLSSTSTNSTFPSLHTLTSTGDGQCLSTITFASTTLISNRLLWQQE